MRNVLKVFILLMMITLSSCTHKDVDVSSMPYKLYRVSDVDTVITIANKNNIDPHLIIKMNELEEPYTIESGQLIKIPDLENKRRPRSYEDDSDGVEIKIAPKQPKQ